MNRKIIFAGAAGALLIGSVAVAQQSPAYQEEQQPATTGQSADTATTAETGAETDTAAGTEMDRAGERG